MNIAIVLGSRVRAWLVIALFSSLAAAAEPEGMDTVRVVNTSSGPRRSSAELRILGWNVAQGAKLESIADYLKSADPGIALLQEVDLNCARTGKRDVAAELAKALGMNAVFGIEFQELGQGSSSAPAHQGQATLSKHPIRNSRVLRLNTEKTRLLPAGLLQEHNFRDVIDGTDPTGRRDKVIDWIMVRGPWKAESGRVIREVTASDHYPLIVQLSPGQ